MPVPPGGILSYATWGSVVAGEPVAVMGGGAQSAVAKAGGANQPVLYVEFRKDGIPVPMVGRKRRPEGSRMMMRKTSLILLGAAAGVAVTLIATQPRILLDGAPAQTAPAATHPPRSPFRGVFQRGRAGYVGKPHESKLNQTALNR